MPSFSRRAFLGSAVAGLAGARLLGANKPADSVQAQLDELARKLTDDPAFQPSTLFLTWQRDPTTTMTVQWVGARGETSDTNVYYTAEQIGPWQAKITTAKS